MRFVFLHRELELGGAQRLVVDVALALKRLGHDVRFLTSHHDPNYSFPETRDPKLFPVTVAGDFLPRIICWAYYLRMIWLAIWLCCFSGWDYDAIFLDQFAYPIPVIKWFGKKGVPVFFYCHFPDKYICQPSRVERICFRWFWDWYEEWATGKADVVMANSQFTIKTFYYAYKSLGHVKVQLLYPCLNENVLISPLNANQRIPEDVVPSNRSFFLSFNRYDFKKNIDLAIKAFALLKTQLSKAEFENVHLVIAGAVNTRIRECYDCYLQLMKLANEFQLQDNITFITTPSTDLKWLLLKNCLSLLYTPTNEHFGIVPLEAMYCARPVIATESGGPMESILHGQSGFLVPVDDVEQFAKCMKTFFENPALADEYGKNGADMVKRKYTFDNFTKELDKIIKEHFKEY